MRRIFLILFITLLTAPAAIHAQTTAKENFEEADAWFEGYVYSDGEDLASLDKALAYVSKAIELDRKFIEARSLRGQIREEKKDLPGAIADFTVLCEMGLSEGFKNRGRLRKKLKDYDGAIRDFTEVIESGDRFVHFYYHERGLVKFEQADLKGAIADYTKAIDLKPNDPASAEFYRSRAATYEKTGERAKAEADRKKDAELSSPGLPIFF